ncbi:MAG TPA: hypothetical protein VNV16_06045 [Methylibium sp.]|nr:hypothetical protein [Methylibium sp.]
MTDDAQSNADWQEVLKWAETCGIENMRGKHATAHHLIEQANTTLAILLAGLGGSLAYATKLLDAGPQPIAFGAAWLCAYLAVLAALLVHKCLRVAPIPPIFNEPLHLAQPNFSLAELRRVELKGLQSRIQRAANRNDEIARWLNNVRTLSVFAPLAFVAAIASRT